MEGEDWLDGPECTEVSEGPEVPEVLEAPEARVRVGPEVPEVLEIECPLTLAEYFFKPSSYHGRSTSQKCEHF